MPKKLAERKPPKLPKSLGACVDLYHDKREERLAANREVEEMKKDETFITNYIIDNLSKKDEEGAVGKNYKAIVVRDVMFSADEWDKLYKYIRENNAFDILNRALNQASLKERTDVLNEKIDAFNAKLPNGDPKRKKRKMLPGVGVIHLTKLSVTKV